MATSDGLHTERLYFQELDGKYQKRKRKRRRYV